MVLLAERAQGAKTGGQALLGGMPIEVHRNYFGAQLASFEAPLELSQDEPDVVDAVLGAGAGAGAGAGKAASAFTGIFIRAPAILEVGEGVEPLAWVTRMRQDANVPILPSSSSSSSQAPASAAAAGPSSSSSLARVIVAARSAHFLVTAFHPELTESPGFHRLFVRHVERVLGRPLLGALHSIAGAGAVLPATCTAEGLAGAEATSNADTSGNAGSHLISRRVVPGLSPV
jgi:pyridoxal 5'-phosphate synthase pdxT subunit